MSLTVKQHVDFWLKSASENMVDMRSNLKSKRRVAALFFGHLAIEKTLKALCAAKQANIPFDHKLLKLAKEAGLILSIIQETELGVITSFNINARYDDYKQRFHQLCTPQYTAKWTATINTWYKYLKPLVVQERAKLPNNSPVK
jgi:HEPN domain-containing protein